MRRLCGAAIRRPWPPAASPPACAQRAAAPWRRGACCSALGARDAGHAGRCIVGLDRRRSTRRRFWTNIGSFPELLRPAADARRRGARVWTDPREWFWGLAPLARPARRHPADRLCRHAARRHRRLRARLPVGARTSSRSAPLRWPVARVLEFCRTVPEIVFALIFVVAFGLGPLPGVLAHRHPHHGRAGQAVLRGGREHRHEAGRGRHRRGRQLDRAWCASRWCRRCCRTSLSYALLRFEINVRGAAVHRLRRRRRHRPGPGRGDPQVLLLRRQRASCC